MQADRRDLRHQGSGPRATRPGQAGACAQLSAQVWRGSRGSQLRWLGLEKPRPTNRRVPPSPPGAPSRCIRGLKRGACRTRNSRDVRCAGGDSQRGADHESAKPPQPGVLPSLLRERPGAQPRGFSARDTESDAACGAVQNLWVIMPYFSGGSVLNIMKFGYPQVRQPPSCAM